MEGKFSIVSSQGEIISYLDDTFFKVVNNKLSISQAGIQSVLLDTLYPVDAVYVQYPIAESNDEAVAFPVAERPATKFGGTWTELYDDENIFFRTKGADGQTRINGMSLDQMQQITGSITNVPGAAAASVYSGAFSGVNSGNGAVGDYVARTIYFNSANSPNSRTGSMTEPKNRLIKIWVRTS